MQGSHDREKSGILLRHFPTGKKSGNVIVLNINEKQFGKNGTLHHVETNTTRADKYYISRLSF